jgi:hypothetical protein
MVPVQPKIPEGSFISTNAEKASRGFLSNRGIIIALVVSVGSVSLAHSQEQESTAEIRQAVVPAKHATVLKKYCFDCHNSSTQEGSVDLESLPFEVSTDIETAERWAKVLNAINSGEMPPADSTPIDDQAKLEFLDALSNQMVLARKILSDSGGVIAMRRLNRREYANSLEKLLGVRPNVEDLPDDQANAGFDTAGASLFFSSDQLELYLLTAEKTIDLALAEPKNRKLKTVRIEPEEYYTRHYQKYVDELKLKLKNARDYKAQANSKDAKPPSAFDMLDKYQAKKQLVNTKKWLPQLEKYLARPETKTGATLIMTIKAGGMTRVKLPTLSPGQQGKYKIRGRAAAYKDAPVRFQYLEFSSGMGSNRNQLGWRKVNGTLEKPEIIEFPIEHPYGEKLMYAVHQRSHQDRGDKNLLTKYQEENGIGTPPGVWIDWVELVGPEVGAPAKSNEIIFDRPKGWNEKQHAQEILRRFAATAFRGKAPGKDYINRLMGHFSENRSRKDSFVAALKEPLAIILTSPSFLYMVEPDADSNSKTLGDYELATRLSYFLWSEPPDDQLMKLAQNGILSKPDVLKAQTQRLLADPKADRFIRGFTHQWLEMERIDMFQFNGMQFPTFDNAVRANAREELFQMVEALLTEELSLSKLLHGDFAVVNNLMADYYGLPKVKGHEFRRVKLPTDSIRGGLLGTAAVHCMGSDGIRTSPVERGAWVLRHLVNNPPPPAPPNVPQLSRLAGEVLPARELQKAHQEQPQCAQCHQKIDPIGYALENFDAAGLWRDKEQVAIGKRKRKRVKTFAIDTRGQLPTGEKFDGYFELRQAVADHEDDFARGFTESLIAYGLGRPFAFTDYDLADDMLKQAKAKNYRLSEFVHALVQSKTFQNK